NGVFVSTDNGTSWIPVNTGLTQLHIRTLAVIGNDLIAGVEAGGVWRRPLSEMIQSGVGESPGAGPVAFRLEQNFPNPFNPATTICYSLPSPAEVRLAVYDVTGREVVVLEEGKQPAGEHRVEFDGKSYGSGMYICRLEADSRILTQKMILLK
ncbi:MAG TPA: T9SS type A sorting domain-containing protein, partial [bacterium]